MAEGCSSQYSLYQPTLNPSVFNMVSLPLCVMSPGPEASPETKVLFFRWVEEIYYPVWCWGGIDLGICFLNRYSTILLFFFFSVTPSFSLPEVPGT